MPDVTAKIDLWRQLLLDTSRRNRLVNFRSGQVGGVDVVHPEPATIWQRLVVDQGQVQFPWKREILGLPTEMIDTDRLAEDHATDGQHTEPPLAHEFTELCQKSGKVAADDLLTDFQDEKLNTRLGRLALLAREAQAEQGVNVLYLAFGFLKWFESDDSTEASRSPLLLVPVRLDRDSVDAPWRLNTVEDEPLPNATLSELLRSQFRITLPQPGEGQPDPEHEADWLAGYLPAVRERVAAFARWEVQDTAALGVFNFQKLAMWEDLGRNAARIAAHPLCRAIAGEASADLRPPGDLPRAEELDEKVPPQATVQILDADSSQQAAIEAVKRGAHLVLDGPPGTGKSQTIANIIAEFLAAGKTVLFVSEKAAALEVVRRRLDACRLGDFCLEIHSARTSRKAVLAELGRCLSLGREGLHDPAEELRQLGDARRDLNAYVRELHRPRPPLGLSAFLVHGELARLDTQKGRSRVTVPGVRDRTAADLARLTATVAKLADCKAVLAEPDRHPWRGCKVAAWSATLRDDIRYHLGRLAGFVPKIVQAADPLIRPGFVDGAMTVPGLRAALADVKAVLAVPLCPAAWFTTNARASAEAVLAVDVAARRHRELAPAVPELSLAAVRRADSGILSAAAMSAIGRVPLITKPASVRELAVKLAETREQLTTLVGKARAADAAATSAIKAAGVSVPVPPSRDLATFAGQLDALTTLGNLPAGWRDPIRRKELLGVLGRAVEDVKTTNAIRAELITRVAPAAFEPQSSTLVKRAAGYQSLFWRLLPFTGWKSVKAKIAEWYPRGLPPTPELLADLRQLVEYHNLAGSLAKVAAAYPVDIIIAAGVPDWSSSFIRVQDVDNALAPFSPTALKAFVPPTGEQLAEPLTTLRTAAGELRAAAEALTTRYEAAPTSPQPPEHGEKDAGVTSLLGEAPNELAAWAGDHAIKVGAERTVCDIAVSLLAPGKDLDPAAVPARLTAAAELARTARDTERAVSVGLSPSVEAAIAKDWAAEVRLAEPLLAFLRGRPGPVSPELSLALSDAARREELTKAMQQLDGLAADGFDASLAFLTGQLFDPDAEVSTGVVLNRLAIQDGPSPAPARQRGEANLASWCSARAADADRLIEWVRFADAERAIQAAGLGTVLDEVRRGEVPVDEAADAIRARFFRLWLDATYQDVPELRGFTTQDHDRLVGRFRDLDRRSLAATPNRIRHTLLTLPTRSGLADGDAPTTSEVGQLLKEVHKKARHMPLRRLFAQTPTLLPRLKPCLMMSPLAVSTYLQDPAMTFDLVIFDEASQVRPHDAICAVYRGRQLVVSGDQKQLPPTSFFDRTVDADSRPEEPDESIADYESILDVCCTLGLTRRRLRWHYRSRREGLIAFSNRFFYENQLVTFPGADDADGTPAVSFHHVPDGRFKDGVNPIEARAVANLVLDHFRDHPGQSLGVIAFSQRQQFRILDELESLRKKRPECEAFFADDRDDPFFVKNLENVQGDERDVIILDVGYGPDDTGKVAMRFGPLNRQGGERRLNVAVTRARERAIVVSSMTAGHIDIARAPGDGPRLLKAYLDYAQNGSAALARAVTEADRGEYESPFEQAVGEELERQGLKLHRQVGCGGFRIDLAILNPDQPGRYRLGVECDGAAYHSSATARDRDRLRQQVLEGLGWRICRVWSTDWVRNRAAQVRRVLDALHGQGEAATSPSPPPDLHPPTQPVPAPVARSQPEEASPRLIDRVPDTEIATLLLDTVQRFGGTGTEDLVKRVSRQLGFQRLGPNIKQRIADVLSHLLQAGRLRVSDPDGRVWLNTPT